MTYDGKLYGLPYYTAYFPIIYNERMMMKAGLDGPPETYQEWAEQARIIQGQGAERRAADLAGQAHRLGRYVGHEHDGRVARRHAPRRQPRHHARGPRVPPVVGRDVPRKVCRMPMASSSIRTTRCAPS